MKRSTSSNSSGMGRGPNESNFLPSTSNDGEMTKQHIQGQALLAPQTQALPSLSTSPKSSVAMPRSWSMLEMTEMKVIHDLQDDMEGMLTIDEEVHPSAMVGRLLSDTSDDDEDDDFLFYDDENGEESVSEQRHQAPSISLSASEAVNINDNNDDEGSASALPSIEEESHEHDHDADYEEGIDKALKNLGKRNVFGTLGMKRARSTLDFRSPSRDLDVSVRRVNVHQSHGYDSDDDDDGGFVNEKYGHGNGNGMSCELDVTLRTVNITNNNDKEMPMSISPDCVAAGDYGEDSLPLNKHSMSNPPTSIGGGEDEDVTTTPTLQQADEQLPSSQSSPSYHHDRDKKPTKSILRRSSFQTLGAALNGNVTSNSSTGTDMTSETCSNGTAGTGGSLKGSGSSTTPTASMNSGMKRITSFSTLEIREYNVTIGDNPGGSHGPPISLDWDYSTEMKICIDKYEKIRPPRRTRSQMYMTGSIRMWTLMKDLGYSMREIKEAAKDAELVRKKRQKSLSKNAITKLGSKMGKMGKMFRRKEAAAA
mmetsp:Transcript_9570/g.14333  ORF Transcript_9570/g.14333 Transcript_9570/m.14333 type:complete len:537 (+) Transcript_9570:138-1748(+)